MIKTVFFDLDGTLTDPVMGITNSVWYAIRHFGIDVKDRSELYKFIGPPLVEAFMESFQMSHDEAFECLHYYREYFEEFGLYENEKYEGIENTLKALKDSGKTLVVATSKPEPFAVKILEHFDLAEYFTFICGAGLDETRTKKWEVIEYALEKLGHPDLSECIMVGDRLHDIEGAHKMGMKAVGVLYGYGNQKEFDEAGADYVVAHHEDLVELLTK